MNEAQERARDRMLAGVDGCRGGWIAVIDDGGRLESRVFADWLRLMLEFQRATLIGVDIPIGLPGRDSRQCDIEARRRLGPPRGSSVFPAPVRGVLTDGLSYQEASDLHRRIDGRGLTGCGATRPRWLSPILSRTACGERSLIWPRPLYPCGTRSAGPDEESCALWGGIGPQAAAVPKVTRPLRVLSLARPLPSAAVRPPAWRRSSGSVGFGQPNTDPTSLIPRTSQD
jgi:hypothetical protein